LPAALAILTSEAAENVTGNDSGCVFGRKSGGSDPRVYGKTLFGFSPSYNHYLREGSGMTILEPLISKEFSTCSVTVFPFSSV
jgi:hypothetical protein